MFCKVVSHTYPDEHTNHSLLCFVFQGVLNHTTPNKHTHWASFSGVVRRMRVCSNKTERCRLRRWRGCGLLTMVWLDRSFFLTVITIISSILCRFPFYKKRTNISFLRHVSYLRPFFLFALHWWWCVERLPQQFDVSLNFQRTYLAAIVIVLVDVIAVS